MITNAQNMYLEAGKDRGQHCWSGQHEVEQIHCCNLHPARIALTKPAGHLHATCQISRQNLLMVLSCRLSASACASALANLNWAPDREYVSAYGILAIGPVYPHSEVSQCLHTRCRRLPDGSQKVMPSIQASQARHGMQTIRYADQVKLPRNDHRASQNEIP